VRHMQKARFNEAGFFYGHFFLLRTRLIQVCETAG